MFQILNGPAKKTFDGERFYSNYMDSWGKLHKYVHFFILYKIEQIVFLKDEKRASE